MRTLVKVVYIYNLKTGVDPKEFEDYYFNERIAQVMKVPKSGEILFR